MGGARVGHSIYVVGGFDRGSGRTTAAVERYDIDSNRWRRVRDMPIALNHPAAAAHAGRLYVIGGYTSAHGLRGPTRRLYRYNPERNRWRRLRSMPTARAALAAAVVGGRLYAVGGARGGHALARLDVYDFRSNRWRRRHGMPTPREHLAATAAGGFVYVLAGRAGAKGNFRVVERYNPRRRRWARLPRMAKARGGIAAATVGKRVVVFGGEETAGTIREVEIYDPGRRRWSRLPDMRTPRHGLVGAALGRRVFAVEGGPKPGLHYSRAIEALDVPKP